MSTAMMKVNVEVKERLEEIKRKSGGTGSLSDVIEKLLEYADKKPKHIELPEETMKDVQKCKEYLRVSSEADVIAITQFHFDSSLNMNMATFEKIQEYQKYRRW